MLTYVIYSHTEYLDVLEIQTDYIKNYENKVLLINKSDVKSNLYNEYNKVIYYDDSLPYATRLLSLSELDDEYILFYHDMDIIINKDDSVIEELVVLMGKNDIDRIDLQYRPLKWNLKTEKIKIKDFILNKSENTDDYIFNVNPSIWKLKTFINLMEEFRNETYRSIEHNTQEYCTQFKIYKLYSENYLNCGWFHCLPMFQFLHITHGGKWFPLNGGRRLEGNNFFSNEYSNIVVKFDLMSSRRGFNKNM